MGVSQPTQNLAYGGAVPALTSRAGLNTFRVERCRNSSKASSRLSNFLHPLDYFSFAYSSSIQLPPFTFSLLCLCSFTCSAQLQDNHLLFILADRADDLAHQLARGIVFKQVWF